MMSLPLVARIENWCRDRGHAPTRIEVLPGDVSPRRYARLFLAEGRCAVAAYYPAAARDAFSRYLATTRLLAGAEIRVAAVLDADEQAGWMLLEDLGSESLYQCGLTTPWSELAYYFRQARDIQQRIAALPAGDLGCLNPPLDRALLACELTVTWDVFLEPRGLLGDAAFECSLRCALAALCDALAAGPQAVCHRDFMARNLMIIGDSLAVIDHQDLRVGPSAYDLASLLNDSLFPPPEVEDLVLEGVSDRFRDDYHRAAAQRTLKALGTFTRATAAGSKLHAPLIRPTLERALRCLARAPETMAIAPAFARLCRSATVG